MSATLGLVIPEIIRSVLAVNPIKHLSFYGRARYYPEYILIIIQDNL